MGVVRNLRQVDADAAGVDLAFRADVHAGLSQAQKAVPARWFYDKTGSELFEAITDLPEYYPTRAETAAMADIMGGAGLAFYQWKKHGRCAGLPAADYYAKARAAYGRVTLPSVFAGLRKDVKLPASVVEDAFLEANPGLQRDQITITCADGMIQEARICLTKDLTPRRCGDDVIRDCRMKDAVMEAVAVRVDGPAR